MTDFALGLGLLFLALVLGRKGEPSPVPPPRPSPEPSPVPPPRPSPEPSPVPPTPPAKAWPKLQGVGDRVLYVPPPKAVQARARELLAQLRMGEARVESDPAQLWADVAFRKEPHGGGKIGVTAYRSRLPIPGVGPGTA